MINNINECVEVFYYNILINKYSAKMCIHLAKNKGDSYIWWEDFIEIAQSIG